MANLAGSPLRSPSLASLAGSPMKGRLSTGSTGGGRLSTTPKIRVGFICGKDTDFVEDPGEAKPGPKYSKVGDESFLSDFPNEWRIDPESHEYLKDCPPGTKGQAHHDTALAWYIHKKYKDIEIDIITPEDLSKERLECNDLNFTLGYNYTSIAIEQTGQGEKPGDARMTEAFKKAVNIFPTWEFEDFIMTKSNYLKALIGADVPVAPTIFAFKGSRSPAKLLAEIRSRGWKKFVMKQSESGFCLGFCKLSVLECEKNAKVLKDYFKDYAHVSEFIVQECIDGFTRNWETRVTFFEGKFMYAIANMAAVSTDDGQEQIVTGMDIPFEFLEPAKRIAQQAIQVLPDLKTAGGKSVKNVMVRVDIGCSDSQVYDKHTNWDPTTKTFFVNEIEPSSTTYFVRWLQFDSMPMWGRLYAQKAREIYKQLQEAGATAADRHAKAASEGETKKSPKGKASEAKVAAKEVAKSGKLKVKAPSKERPLGALVELPAGDIFAKPLTAKAKAKAKRDAANAKLKAEKEAKTAAAKTNKEAKAKTAQKGKAKAKTAAAKTPKGKVMKAAKTKAKAKGRAKGKAKGRA